MPFAHPHVLWLLLFPPLWAGWQLRRRPTAGLPFPSLLLLDGVPLGDASARIRNAILLRAVILALLILALARPRYPDPTTRIPTESVAIQMVLDVSGSMAEEDFFLDGKMISRLAAAKAAFEQFVQGTKEDAQPKLPGRKDDMIGLVTFAARTESVGPPTLSHSVVLKMLADAVPLGTPPDSSTNIGDAVAEAVEVLKRAKPKEKVVILLSDGEHNVPADEVPDALKPRQAARIAAGLGIRVHTISASGERRGLSPSVVDAAPNTPAGSSPAARLEGEEALRDMAEMTGGKSFLASDFPALLQVCQEIDKLERTRVESFQYYRYHELYPWLAVGVLMLSILLFVLEGTRWLRVP